MACLSFSRPIEFHWLDVPEHVRYKLTGISTVKLLTTLQRTVSQSLQWLYQTTSPFCSQLSVTPQYVWSSGFCSCRLSAPWHETVCRHTYMYVDRRTASLHFDVHWKHTYFSSNDVYSALGISAIMRYKLIVYITLRQINNTVWSNYHHCIARVVPHFCCESNIWRHRQTYNPRSPFRFLSRVSTLTRDIDIAIPSVCPSVRHVPVFYRNGLTYVYCHSFFTTR